MFSFLARFLIIVVLLSNPVYAQDRNDGNFEVDFNYGFNKFYMVDGMTLARVKVVNKSEDMDGKVELLVNLSSDESKKVYQSYSEDLFISKNSDKTVDINFFANQDQNLILRILDKDGQVLWSDSIELESPQSPSNVNIGVLSDDFDRINKVDDANPYTSLAKLNDMFPEDKFLLNTLDMIIIDDYNTENLNEGQSTALKSWIEDGGSLIVGTGVNFHKTLKGISYLAGSLNKVDEILHKNLGKGNIVTLPFNLTEEHKTLVLDLVNRYVDLDYAEIDSDIDNGFDFIDYETEEAKSSVDFIKVFFVFFIFFLMFTVYFLLRKVNRLDLVWVVIPLTSFVFFVFIYVYNPVSDSKDILISSVSVTNLIDNVELGRTNSTISLLSSNGKEVKIVSNEDQHIYMDNIMKDVGYYTYNDGDILIYNSLRSGKESEIKFRNDDFLKNNFLKSDEEVMLNIRTDNINIDSEKVTGKIINDSDIDLNDIVLLYGSSFFHIGDIPKKSSRDLDISLKNRVDFIFGNDRAFQIYPIDTSSNSVDILDNNTKSKILSTKLESLYSASSVNLSLIAWSKDSLTKGLRVNDSDVNRIDRNLIFIPFGDYVSSQRLDLPFGVLRAEVMEYPGMNIATYKPKRFSGNGHVVYSFVPKRSLDMDKFYLEEVGVSLQEEANNGAITPYLYNYTTNEWNVQSGDVLKVDESNMDVYYDDEYGVKVSLQTSDRKALIEEPLISASFTKN